MFSKVGFASNFDFIKSKFKGKKMERDFLGLNSKPSFPLVKEEIEEVGVYFLPFWPL